MAYVEMRKKDNKINVLFAILLITVMVFTLFIASINVWAASKDGDDNGNHYGQHKDHGNRGTHKPIQTTPPPTVEATP